MSATSSLVPPVYRIRARDRMLLPLEVTYCSPLLLSLASVSRPLPDAYPPVSHLCHLAEGLSASHSTVHAAPDSGCQRRATSIQLHRQISDDRYMQTCRDVGSVGSVGSIWRKKTWYTSYPLPNTTNPVLLYHSFDRRPIARYNNNNHSVICKANFA